ncbi:UBA-like_superfamily [Hexamita inflata]|uniref:UBA-like superfamily n=1 Tax=Hexamita inflata TaxID=28002 RepID=A0AA86ND59_9EUKA|nr:UBA-like superfamily [Hexamita inflata]CAI9931476.1 UBA-like superfamily [Hexamita inflata]
MNQNILQQFIQITHCSEQQATRFLRMNDNEIQEAINAFFESGEEPENAPVIQKPQPNNKVIEQMMDLTKTSREQAIRYLMDNFNNVNEAAFAFLESGEKPLNIIQEQPSEQTINKMIKLTNTSREQAIRFLMDNLNKVDEAANAFHDSGEKQLGNNPVQDNLWWEKQQREQKQREHYQQREPINEKEEEYKPFQPKLKEQNKNVNKFFNKNNDLVKFQETLKTDYQTAQKYLKGNDFEKAVQNFQNDQKEEENRRKKLQEIEMQKQFENNLMQQNQKEKKQRIDRNGQYQQIDQRTDNQYQQSTQFNEEKYNNGQRNNINSNAPQSMEKDCDQRNSYQNQYQEYNYYENEQNNTRLYTPKRNTNNNCDSCGQQSQNQQQQNQTETQQLDYETLQKQIELNNILFQQLFGDQNYNFAVQQQRIPTVLAESTPQNIYLPQPIQQQTHFKQIQENTKVQIEGNSSQYQDGNKSNSPSIIIETSESSSFTIDLESSDEQTNNKQENKQLQSVFCLDETVLNMSTQSQNIEKKQQYNKKQQTINITLNNDQIKQTQQYQNQQINVQVNSSYHFILFLEQKLNIKTFQFLVTQPQIIQVDQKEDITLIVKTELFDQVNQIIKQYITIDSLSDSLHYNNANNETNNQTQNLPCYQLNKYNQIREQFGNFYAQIQRQNQTYENNVIIQKDLNEAPKLEATIELISENTEATIEQNSKQYVIKFNDNQASNIQSILNLQPEIVYRNQKQKIINE